MFDTMAKQLELQTFGKGKNFKIDEQEFEQFCKGFLFEQIKGDQKLGQYFCEKYKASFNISLERGAQNRYKRKTGVIYDVLLARLENACALECQRKHGKKELKKEDVDLSSSEESFTLLP